MSSKVQSNRDRKSTRLNSSHLVISYAVFCLKKNKEESANAHKHPRRGVTPPTHVDHRPSTEVELQFETRCPTTMHAGLRVRSLFFFLKSPRDPRFPPSPPPRPFPF